MKKQSKHKPKAMFLTRSGKYINLLDVKEDDICLDDIAWALSMQCRYNGQIKKFYSVAEHCINLTHYALQNGPKGLENELAKQCLLHDAAEAYVGDVVNGLKEFFPLFSEIEGRIQDTIYRKYGIFNFDSKLVAAYDKAICFDEMYCLHHSVDPKFLAKGFKPLKEFGQLNPSLKTLDQETGYKVFLHLCRVLEIKPENIKTIKETK